MEAYNLPIKLREWFVKRLVRQKEAENEAMEGASKGRGSKTSLEGGNAPPMMPKPSK